MPDKDGSQKFAHDNSTKAPEGATTGAGIGLLAGGALGWLVGIGIPEYEAKRYAGYVHDGGILLSVHTSDSDEIKKAKMILEQTGAKDISTAGEVANKDFKAPRNVTERARI